jgi:acyl-coenzyme A synthetase/AMP-(fatty) acid ligase
MALSRLRIASASIPLPDAPAREVIAALRPGLLLTDGPETHPCRVAPLSAEWITAALRGAVPPIGRRACDLDAIGRVTTSSGTTGAPKPIAFTWRQIIDRAQRRAAMDRALDDTALILAGNDTNFGFLQRVTTWLAGATLAIGPEIRQLPQAMAALHPTVLILSPGYLQMLVAALPANFQPLPGLRIRISGGMVSAGLVRRAQVRLSPSIQLMYSAAEGGAIARGPASLLESHPGSAGYRLPWVEVEAIDADGTPCPPGVEGELRVRGLEVLSGYRGADGPADAAFRDGWFHPGDLGMVMADGEIRLSGRTDEVINVGGIKIAPHVIEEVLRGSPGIADVAVFGLPSPDGAAALWAAVVGTDLFEPDELISRLRRARPELPLLQVVRTEAVPRTDNGKVDLRRLRQLAPPPPS